MDSINKLYSQYLIIKSIYILGDAPSLNEDFQGLSLDSKTLILSLNRAFSFIASDLHFFACRKFVGEYKELLDKKQKVIHPRAMRDLDLECEYGYNPVRDTEQRQTDRLVVGHSVLIPALHFACLLQPRTISLLGVDLRYYEHWNEAKKSYKKFPARNKICREVKFLRNIFSNIKITCRNKDSMLVRTGVLKTA